MNVTGIIKRIGATQQVSNTFSKRELVITTQEQYPQHLSIDFTQNNCALLDVFQEGQSVTVDINLRGREWTSPQGEVKYFNTLQGWRISPTQAAAPATPDPLASQPSATSSAPSAAASVPSAEQDDQDDLPF